MGAMPKMGVVSAIVMAVNLWAATVSSAPITSDEVRIIDGDTIRIHHQRPDVRLVGFNAPETRRAQCEVERELGGKATASFAILCNKVN